MKTFMTAVLVALVSAGSLSAHHSLGSFDTTKAVRVKGVIVEFHQVNPHSFIYLNQTEADGTMRRWAVEGPSLLQLKRRGFSTDELKPGDVIEVCGYLPKEAIMWQIANADTSRISPAGRLINAEMLVMADGKERSWGDYGIHKCFGPDFSDQHSK